MNNIRSILLSILLPLIALGQFSLLSTQPANNSKNVPLSTTISMTFSEALDTAAFHTIGKDWIFTNADSTFSEAFTNGAKTISVSAVLKPNTAYFLAFYYMKAQSGATITSPTVFYFTTGADFPPYSVAGTVASGTTGISPEGSLVALSTASLMSEQGGEGPPPFVCWGNVNANGTFSVPYVASGKYWPVAVKDVNHDGRIDPEGGIDAIALGDSIIVNNGSVTNCTLTFFSIQRKLFHDALPIADSLAKNLPSDKLLRRIAGWDVDSLGRTHSWEFDYTVNGGAEGKSIRINPFSSSIVPVDPWDFEWVSKMKPIVSFNNIASSATVIANIEAAGGKAIRQQPLTDTTEFRAEMTLSDQKFGWFNSSQIDTNKIYWAVAYVHNYQVTQQQSQWLDGKMYLCDANTGAVLMTQTVMDVNDKQLAPKEFVLSQNYPNPFNPNTTIGFQIHVAGLTTLTVYNILGKEIAQLVNGEMKPGEYSVCFNAADVSSGIYFYRLQNGKYGETKKMVLMK